MPLTDEPPTCSYRARTRSSQAARPPLAADPSPSPAARSPPRRSETALHSGFESEKRSESVNARVARPAGVAVTLSLSGVYLSSERREPQPDGHGARCGPVAGRSDRPQECSAAAAGFVSCAWAMEVEAARTLCASDDRGASSLEARRQANPSGHTPHDGTTSLIV